MDKNCLTCRWEPDWVDWVGREFRRRGGRCRIEIALPVLPATWSVLKEPILMHVDNSGMPTQCKTWEPKAGEEE